MTIIENLIISIITVEIGLFFTRTLLECKLQKRKEKIILVNIISITLCFLFIILFNEILFIIGTIIIYIILLNITFNLNFKKSMPIISSLIFFQLIIEIVLNLIVSDFTKEFVIKLAAFLILIILTKSMKKKIKKIITINKNYSTKITVLTLLSILSIIIFYYFINNNLLIDTKIGICAVAFFTFVSGLIIIINQQNENLNLKTEYEKMLDFEQVYEKELQKEKNIKNEYKEKLIIIKTKILNKDNKHKVIAYINDITEEDDSFSEEEYTKLQYLPNNGLKSLIYFKIANAKLKKINVAVNVSPAVNESNLNKLTAKQFKDLSVIIGIYLDNAIEAAEKSKKKMIGIEMYELEDGVEIIITNSYTGTINQSKLGKEQYTTKGKGHGYGLLLAKSTVNHNRKISSTTEIRPEIYIKYIKIKK